MCVPAIRKRLSDGETVLPRIQASCSLSIEAGVTPHLMYKDKQEVGEEGAITIARKKTDLIML